MHHACIYLIICSYKKTILSYSNRRNRSRTGHLKKTWLVCPRDNWPPIGKSGLSMSLDYSMQSTGNVQYFVYEHSSSYKQIQLKFLQAVESLNPENIIVSGYMAAANILLQNSKNRTNLCSYLP